MKTKEEKVIEPKGECIILNKPFLGGFFDKKGNIGHEIIDFFLDDECKYYIYNNPYGTCPDDITCTENTGAKKGILPQSKKEIYVAKYLVLTSEAVSINDGDADDLGDEDEQDVQEGTEKNKKAKPKQFFIQYVIKLEEKLHRQKHHKKTGELKKAQKWVHEKIIGEKGFKIKYGTVPLNEIYKNDESLYVTFKASAIYKPQQPVPIKTKVYNYQRNKGYLYSDGKSSGNLSEEKKALLKDDFDALKKEVTKIVDEVTPLKPEKLNESNSSCKKQKDTFLNLTMQESNEQVYTNILYSILKLNNGNLLKRFCERKWENGRKSVDFTDDFKFDDVSRETKVNGGRIDITGENKKYRVIIENKVYSGLNGVKTDGTTQLTTYYKWGKEKKREPICFIVAPDFRIDEIKNEVQNEEEKKLLEDEYIVIGYGEVANFIEDNREEIENSEFGYEYLLDDIIKAFKNYGYKNREELYASMFRDAVCESLKRSNGNQVEENQ